MTRILFIEDDEHIREIYGPQLGLEFGAEVVYACSGKEAITILGNDSDFDVIVSDYMMPDGKGIEVLGFKLKNNIRSPFIFFTNTVDPDIPFAQDSYVGVFCKMQFDKLCESIAVVIGKSL